MVAAILLLCLINMGIVNNNLRKSKHKYNKKISKKITVCDFEYKIIPLNPINSLLRSNILLKI